LLGRGALLVATQASTWAITMVWMLVVPRALGPAQLGHYIVSQGVLAVAVALGLVGLDVQLVRAVARRDPSVEIASAWALGLSLVTASSAAGVLFCLFFLDPAAAVLLGLGCWAQAVGNLAFTPLLGRERPAPRALSDVAAKLVFCAGSVMAVEGSGGVGGVCAAYAAGYLLHAGLGVGWGIRAHGIRLRDARWSATRSVFRETRPLGVHLLAQSVYYRADGVMLAPIRGAAAAGVYGAAYRLFDTLSFVTTIYGLLAGPRTARLARENPQQAAREVGTGLVAMAGVAAAAVIGVFLFAGPVVGLVYGPAFEAAVLPLQLLGVALALSILTTPYSWALVAADRQAALARLSVVAAVVNVAANAVAIPLLGITGAAATTVLTEVLLLLGSRQALADHPISPVIVRPLLPRRSRPPAVCSVAR